MISENISLVFSCSAGAEWAEVRSTLGIPQITADSSPSFRLYVGDIAAAHDRKCIDALGITHVVNCGVADLEPHECAPHEGLRYVFVRTSDANFAVRPAPYGTIAESENPTEQWPLAMAHLREARAAGTSALVHCIAGANRSVTTAAVFMALEGYAPTFADALRVIRSVRPQANPMRSYREWGAAASTSLAKA